MSRLWMNNRRRLVRVLATVTAGVAVVACLALVGRSLIDSRGLRAGSALNNDGEGGILQPLPPNTALSVGVVRTSNDSSDLVKLVEARLLRLDPDLQLLGFSALPYGPGPWGSNPPITALEHPLAGAVPLSAFPPLAPNAKEGQAVVMFALRVKPGGAGKAVGVEVRYRQGGRLRKQVFRQQVYVCWVPSFEGEVNCPGVENPNDVFGEFEDEVKGISGRRTERTE